MKIIKIAKDVQEIFNVANKYRTEMMEAHRENTMDECGEVFLNNGKMLSPPFCQFASQDLLDVYTREGYKNVKRICGTFNGYFHCWAELNGRVVVDFTVDQFGGSYPDILIGTYSSHPEYKK